ncbi:unnamed protein product, partial [Didymodactylos carnosus]
TVYGTLTDDTNNMLDANTYNLIVFNAADKILAPGDIKSVTVHFCTLPTSSEPQINLYVLSITDDPTKFNVTDKREKVAFDRTSSAIQTIFLTDSLKVHSGQYIAIRFENYSGSPYSTAERNEHFVNSRTFNEYQEKNSAIPFTNCPNKGIAFSFTVSPTSYVKKHRRWCQVGIIQGGNKFQEYDNMQRERAIAAVYWKSIIDKIKENEHDKDEDEKKEENNKLDKILAEKLNKILAEKPTVRTIATTTNDSQ